MRRCESIFDCRLVGKRDDAGLFCFPVAVFTRCIVLHLKAKERTQKRHNYVELKHDTFRPKIKYLTKMAKME